MAVPGLWTFVPWRHGISIGVPNFFLVNICLHTVSLRSFTEYIGFATVHHKFGKNCVRNSFKSWPQRQHKAAKMDGKYRNPYFISLDPSWRSDSLKFVEIFAWGVRTGIKFPTSSLGLLIYSFSQNFKCLKFFVDVPINCHNSEVVIMSCFHVDLAWALGCVVGSPSNEPALSWS